MLTGESSKNVNLKEYRKLFGKRLRELRQKKGFTLENLDEATAIHWTYIGGIERGERNPSLDSIASLAVGLGVPVYELFRFGGMPYRSSELELLSSDLASVLKKMKKQNREIMVRVMKSLARELNR